MKWIENLWLRSTWKFRRMFRLKNQTIAPIQWGEPLLQSFPDRRLNGLLDEKGEQKLQAIVKECRVISMLTKHFPSKISTKDWQTLLECQNRKQRLQHLKFLRSCEREHEKDMEKKRMKARMRPQEIPGEMPPIPLYYPATKLAKDQRSVAWQRVARAHRLDEPTLVIDCRFLPFLSPRGAELTAMQLKYLISENRDSRAPWQLFFANFDISMDRLRRLKEKHLSVVDSSSTCSPILSSQSFTELFARERIVYLSPDAEEEIEDMHEHDVYILGGIVDRVVEKGVPRNASQQTATAENVICKRLPLDKYVKNVVFF
ncbi:hypothetical protein Q1695_006561 [Nippostrongylus brasiliensis]|nr:hypothetical protein Q1695_006561 [Nippostrongylus brasiliensis]